MGGSVVRPARGTADAVDSTLHRRLPSPPRPPVGGRATIPTVPQATHPRTSARSRFTPSPRFYPGGWPRGLASPVLERACVTRIRGGARCRLRPTFADGADGAALNAPDATTAKGRVVPLEWTEHALRAMMMWW